MNRNLARWMMVLAVLALPRIGWGMKVLPLTIEERMERADWVFVGTCVEKRSEIDLTLDRVVTYYTFSVSEVIKGKMGTRVTFKQYGGEVAGRSTRILGMPTYQEQEEIVLFLRPESRFGFSSPVGAFQGMYPVVLDRAAKKKVVYVPDRDARAAGMSAPKIAPPDSILPPPVGSPIPLENFIAALRRMVKAKDRR